MANYRAALKVLIAMFRTTKVSDFGPKKLKAVQDALAAKHVRIQVNNSLSRIKQMFEWGASQEIVSATTFMAVKTVKNLKRGRSKAKEGQPVLPVPQEHLDATLPELTPTVRSMVQLQLLTGMRPGEVLKMRVKELDVGRFILRRSTPNEMHSDSVFPLRGPLEAVVYHTWFLHCE